MPHDVDESQLDAMAARVAAVVTEEQAARVDKPLETVTPDFVAKCAGFAEKGDGILHSALFRGKFVYVPETKTWFQWAGQFWEQTHVHRVEASVDEVGVKYREVAAHYEKLAQEASDAGDKEQATRLSFSAERLRKRASYLNTSRGVNACLKFTLANTDPLITRPDVWDVDPWLLGVANGVVDLKTGNIDRGDHRTTSGAPAPSSGKDWTSRLRCGSAACPNSSAHTKASRTTSIKCLAMPSRGCHPSLYFSCFTGTGGATGRPSSWRR